MPFLKRLGFFLLGLSVGLVFLAIFLKKKTEETGVTFCYLPNCRVLKDIRSKPLAYSDNINELMEDGSLDSTDIARYLHDGKVLFKKSNTKTKPCKTYVIEGSAQQQQALLHLTNCEDRVTLENLTY